MVALHTRHPFPGLVSAQETDKLRCDQRGRGMVDIPYPRSSCSRFVDVILVQPELVPGQDNPSEAVLGLVTWQHYYLIRPL